MARICLLPHSVRLRGQELAWALAVAVILVGAGASRGDEWKFDVVHLKNGKSFQGLLQKETAREITLDYVRRPVGARTTIFRTSFSPAEVERIDRLSAADRQVLAARVQALDPTGKGEAARMEDLEIKPVPWGANGKGGWSYTSEYFHLLSNAREDIVRRAAVRLEQIFLAYTRFLPPRRPAAPPTTILLCQSLAEYRDLLKNQGREILNPAFYDAARNQVVCASDLERLGEVLERVRRRHQRLLLDLKERETELARLYAGKVPASELIKIRATRDQIRRADDANEKTFHGATRRLFQTLYHEAFHAYLANCVYPPGEAEVPRWLNEGLAQIFETAILEAGELRLGHADADRLGRIKTVLRKGEFVALADLLRAGPKQFLVAHATDQENSDSYYLASWILAFYLAFEQRKLGTPELDRYVCAMKAGADPLEAFRELVGQPLERFEAAFHQYILRLRIDGSVDRPGGELEDKQSR